MPMSTVSSLPNLARHSGGAKLTDMDATSSRKYEQGLERERIVDKDRIRRMQGALYFLLIVVVLLGTFITYLVHFRKALVPRNDTALEHSLYSGGVAVAYLNNVNTSHAVGYVRFYAESPDTVRMIASVYGLEPRSRHGMRVYEFGAEELSVGDHLDIHRVGRHGCPGSVEGHHSGDLGNIGANSLGVGLIDQRMQNLDLTSFVGRFVAVHVGEDDCITQPDGNAGSIYAQGIIALEKAELYAGDPPPMPSAEAVEDSQLAVPSDASVSTTKSSRARTTTSATSTKTTTTADSLRAQEAAARIESSSHDLEESSAAIQQLLTAIRESVSELKEARDHRTDAVTVTTTTTAKRTHTTTTVPSPASMWGDDEDYFDDDDDDDESIDPIEVEADMSESDQVPEADSLMVSQEFSGAHRSRIEEAMEDDEGTTEGQGNILQTPAESTATDDSGELSSVKNLLDRIAKRASAIEHENASRASSRLRNSEAISGAAIVPDDRTSESAGSSTSATVANAVVQAATNTVDTTPSTTTSTTHKHTSALTELSTESSTANTHSTAVTEAQTESSTATTQKSAAVSEMQANTSPATMYTSAVTEAARETTTTATTATVSIDSTSAPNSATETSAKAPELVPTVAMDLTSSPAPGVDAGSLLVLTTQSSTAPLVNLTLSTEVHIDSPTEPEGGDGLLTATPSIAETSDASRQQSSTSSPSEEMSTVTDLAMTVGTTQEVSTSASTVAAADLSLVDTKVATETSTTSVISGSDIIPTTAAPTESSPPLNGAADTTAAPTEQSVLTSDASLASMLDSLAADVAVAAGSNITTTVMQASVETSTSTTTTASSTSAASAPTDAPGFWESIFGKGEEAASGAEKSLSTQVLAINSTADLSSSSSFKEVIVSEARANVPNAAADAIASTEPTTLTTTEYTEAMTTSTTEKPPMSIEYPLEDLGMLQTGFYITSPPATIKYDSSGSIVFTVWPPLPAGLEITQQGEIVGLPSEPISTTTFTVQATNAAGEKASTEISLGVVPGASVCADITSCSNIALRGDCGWCQTSLEALHGDFSGPSEEPPEKMDACGFWIFTPMDCPSTCVSITQCSDIGLPEYRTCGWCEGDNTAYVGDMYQPKYNGCSGNWIFDPSSCPSSSPGFSFGNSEVYVPSSDSPSSESCDSVHECNEIGRPEYLECGWCSSAHHSYAGSHFGPNFPYFCPSTDWIWHVSSCPSDAPITESPFASFFGGGDNAATEIHSEDAHNCGALTECHQIETKSTCGWCKDEIHEGGFEGNRDGPNGWHCDDWKWYGFSCDDVSVGDVDSMMDPELDDSNRLQSASSVLQMILNGQDPSFVQQRERRNLRKSAV